MVRKLNKNNEKSKEEIEKDLLQLEVSTEKEIEEINKQRQKDFNDGELDVGYFFSVVFNTREERNNWLEKYKLLSKLEEDFIIQSKNLTL